MVVILLAGGLSACSGQVKYLLDFFNYYKCGFSEHREVFILIFLSKNNAKFSLDIFMKSLACEPMPCLVSLSLAFATVPKCGLHINVG